MVNDSLRRLKEQKNQVENSIENSRTMITGTTEKVRRLREASGLMETSIESLRNIKMNIDDFEVTKAKWEGEEERNSLPLYSGRGVR